MRPYPTRLALAATVGLLACSEPLPCGGGMCGTAILITTGDARTFFPPTLGASVEAAVVDQVFLKLADLGLGLNTNGDAGFVPRLARAWRFEDSLTLVFEMDPRARWQDGAPVTAHDVAFTWAVYRDPAVNSSAAPLIASITSVTARDDHTAEFRFQRAYLEQFYDAVHHVRILPRHLLDSIPRTRLAKHPFSRAPIGNGPYRFVAWKPAESVELVADSGFFLGRPGLARVIWRIVPDPSTAVSALIAGEGDAMDHLLTPENVERGKAAPNLRIIEYPSLTFIYLDFNLVDPANRSRPHPVLGDREMRRAIFRAIDREPLVETVLAGSGYLPVGPASRVPVVGRDTTIAQLGFDLEGARRTLDSLGWRDTDGDGIRERGGRRLTFRIAYPTSSGMRQRTAVILRDQLQRAGMDAVIDGSEYTTFQARNEAGRFDATLMNWNDDPTPSSIRQTFTTAAIGAFNYGRYSSPAFDRLIDEATFAPDTATAFARWRDAYAVINADAPAVWLYTLKQTSAVHRRIENVTIRPDQWTATLWTWRVTPGREIPRDRVAQAAVSAP